MSDSTDGFHVCIVASDFESSIAFYEALGFSTEGQLSLKDHPELQMQYLSHPCGGLVEVITYRDPKHDAPPAVQRDMQGGLNHIGFHVPDLQKVKETLQREEVEIIEEGSRGQYSFIFARGPDNEIIGFAHIEE